MSYLYEETEEKIAEKFFAIINRTLTLYGYQDLEPEARRVTLEETERLLKNKDVLSSNKLQLIHYLEALQQQVWVSDAEKCAIAAILQTWNEAPL